MGDAAAAEDMYEVDAVLDVDDVGKPKGKRNFLVSVLKPHI